MTTETTPPREKTPKVYRAMNKVQGALAKVGIKKDSLNEQQKYAFRGIDDIYNTLAGLLALHQLVIIPRVVGKKMEERTANSGAPIFSVTVKVEYDFVSAQDGSTHTATVMGEAMDSGDKATNKAMSAAYKYLCLQTFCIPTEGDNDADGTTHNLTPAKQAYADQAGAGTPDRRVSKPSSTLPPTQTRIDWRMCVVPKFIKKYAGQNLGAMAEKDVLYWAGVFEPKKFRGRIQPADIAFRAALTLAAQFYQPGFVPTTARGRTTSAQSGHQPDAPDDFGDDQGPMDEFGNPVN